MAVEQYHVTQVDDGETNVVGPLPLNTLEVVFVLCTFAVRLINNLSTCRELNEYHGL